MTPSAASTGIGNHHSLDRRQAVGRPGQPLGRRLQSRARRDERTRRLRRCATVDAAVAAATEAAPVLGPDVAGRAGADPLRFPRARRAPQARAGRDPDARARQGPVRRAWRGQPRTRGRRVRLRPAAPPQGRVLRERVDRRRQLLHPPAARGGRGHHALQLPGDGADVDVSARDRLRERVHPEAVGEGSVGRAVLCRAPGGGRPAARRLQRRPRRQGGCRRHPGASGHSGGELRRVDADRPLHLRDRDASTASACRRSAARRTT